jgi:hypothetical protein
MGNVGNCIFIFLVVLDCCISYIKEATDLNELKWGKKKLVQHLLGKPLAKQSLGKFLDYFPSLSLCAPLVFN